MIAGVAIIFMFLNAFLPLNFSPVEAEATEYPFKLTIALEKTTYQLREPVEAILYLQNIANEDVTYRHPSQLDLVVYDARFHQVFRWGEWHGWILMWVPPQKIEPGEIRNFTLTWYQEVGFERIEQGVYNKYWAQPGTYYVLGFFSSYTYSLELETPAIRFRIVGR